MVITCLRCKWLAIFETTPVKVWLQNIKNLDLGDLFIGIHFPKSLFLSSIGDICAHLLYLTSLPSNKISRSQNAKPEPRKKKKITKRNMVTWQCDILQKTHQLRSFFWGRKKKQHILSCRKIPHLHSGACRCSRSRSAARPRREEPPVLPLVAMTESCRRIHSSFGSPTFGSSENLQKCLGRVSLLKLKCLKSHSVPMNSWLQKIPMAPVFQQIGDGFPMKSCDLCTLQRWNSRNIHMSKKFACEMRCVFAEEVRAVHRTLYNWLHVTPCFKISISPPNRTPQQIRSFFRFSHHLFPPPVLLVPEPRKEV